MLATALDPRVGQVVLWSLIGIYATCFGVPLLLFVRLRTPLIPPSAEAGEEAIARHLRRLSARLSRHRLIERTVVPSADAIEQALKMLDEHAERQIRQEAALVFVSTAVSQSGRLDGLFVLVAQARLIWKVAHVYWQRPTIREFLFLYANVGSAVFAAQSLEDLDLSEVLEPVMPSLAEAAGVGATVVLAPVASVVADSLLQGSVNALLTLRVGCIARRYCRGLPVPDHRAVRRSASREAALMLPRLIAEPLKAIKGAMASRAASRVANAAKFAVHKVSEHVNPFRTASSGSPSSEQPA